MRTSAILSIVAILAVLLAACEPTTTDDIDTVPADAPADALAPAGDAQGEPADTAADSDTDESAAPDEPSGQDADDATAADTASSADMVASVEGEPILLSDFQRQAFDTQRYFVEQGLDPSTDDGQRQLRALRRQVLEDMVNQKLIELAADELGVSVSEAAVTSSIQSYIDEMGGTEEFEASLEQAGTTRDEVLAMERAAMIGEQVLERISGDVPTTTEFVHARHVLCETREACDAALARIEGDEAFEDVAKDVSVDTISAERGGDLEWVGRGMLPSQQVEDALFALEPGTLSSVVETDFGYHIFELIERDPNHELSEEQRYQLQEKRLLDWLTERRSEAEVIIYVDDLKPPDAP